MNTAEPTFFTNRPLSLGGRAGRHTVIKSGQAALADLRE
jgi:hypothetical protein